MENQIENKLNQIKLINWSCYLLYFGLDQFIIKVPKLNGLSHLYP